MFWFLETFVCIQSSLVSELLQRLDLELTLAAGVSDQAGNPCWSWY